MHVWILDLGELEAVSVALALFMFSGIFLVLQSVHSVFGPFKTFMLVVLVKETSAQMSRARFFPTEHCNLKANSLIHFTIQFDLESDSFIIYDTNFILVI